MTINSIEVVIYTAYFVLPGYIIDGVIESIIPRGQKSDGEKIIRCIGYSLVEYACWYWKISQISNGKWHWLYLLLWIVGTSLFTGLVLGVIKKWQPIRYVMSLFDVMVQSPFPTSWDYKFANLLEGRRIVVALIDGSFIRGLYYNKSMASSDVNNRDIYLEQCCMVDEETGEWYLVKNSDGVWIPEKSIKYITIWEEKND